MPLTPRRAAAAAKEKKKKKKQQTKSKSVLYAGDRHAIRGNKKQQQQQQDHHSSDTNISLARTNSATNNNLTSISPNSKVEKKRNREKDLKKGATDGQLPTKAKGLLRGKGEEETEPMDMTMLDLREEVLTLREMVRHLKKDRVFDQERIEALTRELRELKEAKMT